MKIGTIIIILFVLALIAAGAFIYFGAAASPAEPEAYTEEVTLEEKSANGGVIATLASAGIESALADVSAEQVYIAYDLPQDMDADITQRYVMGIAASAGANSKNLVILQYRDEKPKVSWTVASEDFDSFIRDEITGDEFDSRIKKQEF